MKDGHVVNTGKTGQQLGALPLGEYWTPLTLALRRHQIVVDAHDQHVSKVTSGLQVAQVSNVQQVKVSVGEDNRAACSPKLITQTRKLVERNYLPHSVPTSLAVTASGYVRYTDERQPSVTLFESGRDFCSAGLRIAPAPDNNTGCNLGQ